MQNHHPQPVSRRWAIPQFAALVAALCAACGATVVHARLPDVPTGFVGTQIDDPGGEVGDITNGGQFGTCGELCPPVSAGDVTGDGVRDGRDIARFTAILFSPFTTLAEICAADFDDDGGIDPGDILGFSQALLQGTHAPDVTILQNGVVVCNPTYPYEMEAYDEGDLPDLRDFASEHDIFAGIDMQADWKDREWEMIQAIVRFVSSRLHWHGRDIEFSLAPRAKLILDTLADDGTITGWGDDDLYGNVSGVDDIVPNSGFMAVEAGQHHSLALRITGVIVAWGRNQFGQGTAPTPNADFIAIAAGGNHNLALSANGSIVAWGDNSVGQCNVPSPNSGFIALDAGASFSIGLRFDGTVVQWGSMSTTVPFNGAWQTHVTQVAAGSDHCVAILDDGSVVAWGSNNDGQCNVPSTFLGQPITNNVLAIAADARRSYAVLATHSNVISWGLPLTITFPVSTFRIWSNPTCQYAIGRRSVDPPTIEINGTGEQPSGPFPLPPTNLAWVSFAPGENFALGLASHHWSCGSLAYAVIGMCVAHGIPARRVGGNDVNCGGDVMVEVYSTRFNKWVLFFPHANRWIEGADGIPQSIAQMRAHHDAGNYAITVAYEAGFVGRGYRAIPANGSGLVFQPHPICTAPIFPHIPLAWWSNTLLTPPAETDLFEYNHTFAANKWNHFPPQGDSISAFLYDDYEDVSAECGGGWLNVPVVADDDTNLTYPLNNIQATAERQDVNKVQLTFIHNMNPKTGGFDHYETSLDGGNTWETIALEFVGEGVYNWYPTTNATLMIRGVNEAGVHSPDIVINFTVE
ncbi:MAG TPA: hypothetical protein VJZ71_14440 [Phycisphaerae bacterium]|nr:hypothetical protein [Phycisphaerae bacterium]